MSRYHNLTRIIAYEQGELDHQELVEFFQELIDSGEVWRMPNHFGRTASTLIEVGECRRMSA